MPRCSILSKALFLPALLFAGATAANAAQPSDPAALEIVHAAVAAELHADATDHSNWTYRESDATDDKRAVYTTIETPQGSLRRLIEMNGQPLSAAAAATETERIQRYVADPAAQARARKSAAHDDAQATELLKMLPDAFIWTRAGDSPEGEMLHFRPNPDFDPPDMQSRVMGTMEGDMIVTHEAHRIRTLRGKLSEDVLIGFGILGKLNRGGTFDVERRERGPGIWQIAETHVHIGGHALLFKTIGQQEDDVKTGWKPSTASTLEEAARQLDAGR
jgi:hypothetical protein